MARVVRILALVRGIGPHEYRAELESWDPGDDPAERLSPAQVEADLARVRARGFFMCQIDLLAELDDARRVADECSRGMEFAPNGPSGSNPAREQVEGHVRRLILAPPVPPPDRPFELLADALRERGLRIGEQTLEAAPFAIEFDTVARHLMADSDED
jgi:hypothetical protein